VLINLKNSTFRKTAGEIMKNIHFKSKLLPKLILALFLLGLLILSVGLNQKMRASSLKIPVLDTQIEQGILKFIQKQREEQQKVQVNRQKNSIQKAKNLRPVSKTRDHIYGNPDAEISLIEYSDFECPFCKRFHPTPKRLVKAYEGKVNWVYRHFPLGFHNPLAQKEAEASECANELGGNDAFWKYADLIYERTRSNGQGLAMEKLPSMASEIGLDSQVFQSCLDSGKYADRVKEDIREGASIGVSGTPATFVFHHKTGRVLMQSGAYPFETFKGLIDSLLN